MDIFGALVWLATHFIGIFQKGAGVFTGLVTGIVPLLIVLMTAVYALTRLIGAERIDRIVQVAARPGLQYYPLRYLVAPVLSVFFLTNPMAYTQGRWFPEKYKPAFYDSAVSYVHPPLGLFPHINPGEIFVWAGIAAGISKLGLSLPELAVRYALVGLVVIFIRGIVTERITAFLMSRQRKGEALEAEAKATAVSQAGTPELETEPSRGQAGTPELEPSPGAARPEHLTSKPSGRGAE